MQHVSSVQEVVLVVEDRGHLVSTVQQSASQVAVLQQHLVAVAEERLAHLGLHAYAAATDHHVVFHLLTHHAQRFLF